MKLQRTDDAGFRVMCVRRGLWRLGWASLLLLIVESACVHVPYPGSAGDVAERFPWNEYSGGLVSGDQFSRDELPTEYCARLAKISDHNSQTSLGLGIGTTLLGTAAAIVGAVIGPDPTADAKPAAEKWFYQRRDSLLIASGALMAIPSSLLFAHSKYSHEAAATSGAAAKSGDPGSEVLKNCLKVRDSILAGRDRLIQIAQEQAEAAIKKTKDAAKATEDALEKEEQLVDSTASAPHDGGVGSLAFTPEQQRVVTVLQALIVKQRKALGQPWSCMKEMPNVRAGHCYGSVKSVDGRAGDDSICIQHEEKFFFRNASVGATQFFQVCSEDRPIHCQCNGAFVDDEAANSDRDAGVNE